MHAIFLLVFIACQWAIVGCNPVGQIIYDAGTNNNGSLDAGADKDSGYEGDGDDGGGDDGGMNPDGPQPGDGDANMDADSGAPIDCDTYPSLPVDYEVLVGFSGSEDFVFDSDGTIVGEQYGNLVRHTLSGSSSVFVPNVGVVAGMRFLDNGDLVAAMVQEGALRRFTPSGGSQVIVGGLQYPNGVEVDMDNLIYVSEFDSGRVRQVDPDSGDFTIIAADLYNPNGLAFEPTYRILYVCSWGSGAIHAIERDQQDQWLEPRLLAEIPDDAGLDGLEVDACGYVYVTQYLVGTVWRISPDGREIEEVFSVDSEWIPNLHWGSGIGGWDGHSVYVMDRDKGRIFKANMRVPGKPRPFP